MTEAQIEARAERKMDALDQRLIEGELTQAQYDAAARQLSRDVSKSLAGAIARAIAS